MARNPRPIDPRQGPLQAFAVELRRLRQAAGDPTYRAMSVRAGFGATTLSEAAGGVRKPSLDVTLAFVEVCGGDPAEWRERWRQLDRILASPATDHGTDADSLDEAGEIGRTRDHAAVALGGGPDDAPVATPVLSPEVPEAVREAEAIVAMASADLAAARPRKRRPGAAPSSSISLGGRLHPTPRIALLGVTVIALIAAVMLVPHLLRTGSSTPKTTAAALHASPSSSAESCTSTPSNGATFTGETYEPGTNIRTGANLDAPVIATMSAQCLLSFSGYCLGQPLSDEVSGTPDMRWFKLADGRGVVASAVIHGNPPPNLPPTACPEDAPPPAEVHLHVAPAADVQNAVTLSANAVAAPIVGYAAYYSQQQGTATDAPIWHELALNDSAYQPRPEWPLANVRPAINALPGAPTGTVPVVAVACYGGGAPSEVIDASALRLGSPSTTVAVQLTRQDLATAERAACQYPSVG